MFIHGCYGISPRLAASRYFSLADTLRKSVFQLLSYQTRPQGTFLLDVGISKRVRDWPTVWVSVLRRSPEMDILQILFILNVSIWQ